MKKSILLFSVAAGLGWITLSSYQDGPGAHGFNYTGGPGSSGNCSQAGCHGNNTPATSVQWTQLQDVLTNEIVTKYQGGRLYKVTISSFLLGVTNPHSFGFQIMSVNGTGAQAGNIGMANFPNTHVIPVGGRQILEHNLPLGGSNNTISISFDWTAPPAGTGPVTFHAMFNAVNLNGLADAGDRPSNPFSHVVNERGVGVAELDARIEIAAYPNPSPGDFALKFEDADAGTYEVTAIDLSGRIIHTQTIDISMGVANTTIHAAGWASGMYLLRINKGQAMRTLTVVKQ